MTVIERSAKFEWKGDKDIKDCDEDWEIWDAIQVNHAEMEIRVQIALAKPDQVGRKATRIFHLGVLEPRNRDSSIEPERWMDLPFRTTALDNPAANFLYSSWALYNHLLLGLRASAIPMHSLVCLWMDLPIFRKQDPKWRRQKGYCMSIQSILCTRVKCTLTTFRFLDFTIGHCNGEVEQGIMLM